MPTYKSANAYPRTKIAQTLTNNPLGIRNRFITVNGAVDLDPDFVAWSNETPVHIAGVVRDSNEAVVAGATVKLVRQRDDRRVKTTTSDGSGNYSFNRSPRDTNTYYVIAYSVTGGVTQIHGTSERGLVGT